MFMKVLNKEVAPRKRTTKLVIKNLGGAVWRILTPELLKYVI